MRKTMMMLASEHDPVDVILRQHVATLSVTQLESLWLYQRMFFGNIDNPKNEKLTDLSGREWAYMTPLLILALWIGVYPKPFLAFIEKPVNSVVKQVRPEYQTGGSVHAATKAPAAAPAAATQPAHAPEK